MEIDEDDDDGDENVDDGDDDDDDDDDDNDRSCLDGDSGGSKISDGSGRLAMLMIILQVMQVPFIFVGMIV